MSKKLKVVQKPGLEVPVEIIADSIKEISAGVKKMRAGQLNDKAIIILIHKSSGVAQDIVRKVLDGMENLEREYLK